MVINKLRFKSFFIAALFALVFFVGIARAAFSETINYQGKLTDNSGNVVADGSYNMNFKLCSDSDCSSVLYEEAWVDGDKVEVTNGLFSVLIGSVAGGLGAVDFNQDIYLEVSVGGTDATPSWEILTPRKRLGAVPNSFNSQKLDGLASTSFLRSDATNTLGVIDNLVVGAINVSSPESYSLISFSSQVATGSSIVYWASGDEPRLHLINGATSIYGSGDIGGEKNMLKLATDFLTAGNDGDGTSLVFESRKQDSGFFGSMGSPYQTGKIVSIMTENDENDPHSYLALFGGSTEGLRVLDDGNIGIGTTTPTEKLVVDNGSINAFNSFDYDYWDGAVTTTFNYQNAFKSNALIVSDFLGTSSIGVYGYASSTDYDNDYAQSIGVAGEGLFGVVGFGQIGSVSIGISEGEGIGVYGIGSTAGGYLMGDAFGFASEGDVGGSTHGNHQGLKVSSNGDGLIIDISSDTLSSGFCSSPDYDNQEDCESNGYIWRESGLPAYSIYSESGINYFGGNVGIGTSTPQQNLVVSGNAYFDGNVTSTGYAHLATTTMAYDSIFGDPSGANLRVSTFDLFSGVIKASELIANTGHPAIPQLLSVQGVLAVREGVSGMPTFAFSDASFSESATIVYNTSTDRIGFPDAGIDHVYSWLDSGDYYNDTAIYSAIENIVTNLYTGDSSGLGAGWYVENRSANPSTGTVGIIAKGYNDVNIGVGVYAEGTTIGVNGNSSGVGLMGTSDSGIGVLGQSQSDYAVAGLSDSYSAGYFESTNFSGAAVDIYGTEGTGLMVTTGNAIFPGAIFYNSTSSGITLQVRDYTDNPSFEMTSDGDGYFYNQLGIGTSSTASASLSVLGDSYFDGSVTSTGKLTTDGLEITGSGTSTFAGTINLTSGCFAINGTCLSGTGDNYFYSTTTNNYFVASTSNWTLDANGATTMLTPSSTIPVWVKSGLYASSTLYVSGASTLNSLSVLSTSTLNDVLPSSSLTYSLGSSAYRWQDVWTKNLNIGTSTWSLSPTSNGDFGVYDAAQGSGNARMVIGASDGYVGIGTSTPSSLLHISRTSGDAIFSISNSGNSNTSGINFTREALSGVGVSGGSVFMDSDTSSNNALLYIQAQASGAHSGITSSLTAGNGVRLLLHGGTGVFSIENGATESLRILSSGNVGIGTATPGTLLDVAGTSTADNAVLSSKLFFRDNIQLDDLSPYYGIGVSSLDLGGGASKATRFSDFYGLSFATYGDDRLVINTSGNIGIATTTPSEKLVIIGNQLIDNGALYFDNDSGGDRYIYGPTNNDLVISPRGNSGNEGLAITYNSSSTIFAQFDSVNGYLGLGTTAPTSLLTVGSATPLKVNSSGNITAVRGVAMSWPSAQGAAGTFLQNDGSGNLSWATPSGSDSVGYGVAGSMPFYSATGTAVTSTGEIFYSNTLGTAGYSTLKIGSSTPSNNIGTLIARYINSGFTGNGITTGLTTYIGDGYDYPSLIGDGDGSAGGNVYLANGGDGGSGMFGNGASGGNGGNVYMVQGGDEAGDYVGNDGSVYIGREASNGNKNAKLLVMGRIGVNTTTPGVALHVYGSAPSQYIDAAVNTNPSLEFRETNIRKWHLYNDNTSDRLYIVDDDDNNGVYIAQDATSWTANSDVRLKENITPINDALQKVLALTGYTYNFIGTDRTEIGLIAQEAQVQFPELVDTSGEYWGISYDRIGPVLVQAIKEQQIQIEELAVAVTSSSQNDLPVSENSSSLDVLQVASAATFYGTITVIGEAGFTSKVTFKNDVDIEGKLYLDNDQVGTATIVAGSTTVAVLFEKPFNSIPKVLATPQTSDENIFVRIAISNKSVEGFTIILDQAPTSDLLVDWLAIGSKYIEESLVVPDPVEEEVDIEQLVEESPAGNEEETIDNSEVAPSTTENLLEQENDQENIVSSVDLSIESEEESQQNEVHSIQELEPEIIETPEI